MLPDASTDETPKNESKKNKNSCQTSPKLKAILARLRYVGEHVFGGDLAAYGEAVGFTEHWIKRILNENTRLRMTTFTQFVESGVVSAEWLFCGSGPMLANDCRKDDIAAYVPPVTINNAAPCIDSTMLGVPGLLEMQPIMQPDEYVVTKDAMAFLPLARATFHSRANEKPVILFVNSDVICAGVTPIIKSLLANKVITHIAMTSSAAVADYQLAKADTTDLTGFNTALKIAANSGVGIAEGIARWGLAPTDNRDMSLLAAAYDSGASASVHTTFGDTAWHLVPAINGAEFGSILGATSYVDLLAFTQQVFSLAGDPPGTFIVAGAAKPALQILSTAIDAGHRLPEPLEFNGLTIARLSNMPAKKNLEFFLAGDYRVLFSQFLDICQAVYTGKFERFLYERYGHKLLDRKQPDPVAD